MATGAADGDTVHFACSESVITCQICMDVFESPRILPCQHTFCKKCVVSLLSKHCLDDNGCTKKCSFPCPNCRRECKIRQKGNYTIEEHLKCFPESLLLKTFLDSVDKNQSNEVNEKRCQLDKETETPKHVNDSYPKDNGDKTFISRFTKIAIEKRLLQYVLFLFNLDSFLVRVNKMYSGSLERVKRTEFVTHLQMFMDIPMYRRDHMLNQLQALASFEILDNNISLHAAEMLEMRMKTSIQDIMHRTDNDIGCVFYDVQTQTDETDLDNTIGRAFKDTHTQTDEDGLEIKWQNVLSFLLIKNTSLVQKLLLILFVRHDAGLTILDCNLFNTILFRKIRYWFLLTKSYELVALIYLGGQSFLPSLLVLISTYLVLVFFFKSLQKYMDGGILIGNILPFFPIFLINLNFYTNLCRSSIYLNAVLQLDIWLLFTVFILELVPEILAVLLMFILDVCGKGHLMVRYGPIINPHQVGDGMHLW